MVLKEATEIQLDCFNIEPLASFLRWTKYSGITPLQFKKIQKVWHVTYSPTLFMFGCFYVTCFDLIITGLIFTDNQLVEIRGINKVAWFGSWVIDSIVAMATVTTLVFGAPRRMRRFLACWSQLQKINADLQKHYFPKPWSMKKTMALISLMMGLMTVNLIDFAFALAASRVGFSKKTALSKTLAYIMYMSFYWIVFLGLLQFCFIVLNICSTFQAINNFLRNLLQEVFNINDNKPEKIRRLALSYTSTCDVVQEVDSSFGLVLIMILTFMSFNILLNSFYLIIVFMSPKSSEQTHIVQYALEIFWILTYVVAVIIMTEPCHLTQVEMKLTRRLVSELMLQPRSELPPLAGELEQFFKSLSINHVEYKPLSLVSLSRSLLLTIMGTVTTYLVILLNP